MNQRTVLVLASSVFLNNMVCGVSFPVVSSEYTLPGGFRMQVTDSEYGAAAF